MSDLADFWKTQKSLTEWLEDINHKDAAAIRREDNDKRERLKVLNKIIGLPFDEPVQFEALELAKNTPAVQDYLNKHGDELCALRLIPKADGLPKLRMRGKSIAEAYEWFKQQEIDVTKYRADFVPHVEDTRWATIFIVNKHGISGEITRGGHHELTQGFHESEKPTVFSFDFRDWHIEPEDESVLTYVKGLAKFLLISEGAKQVELAESLGATFAYNYLEGYFETTDSEEFGTWFIDYSPSLGRMYEDFIVQKNDSSKGLVKGQTGCRGQAEGKVVIVEPDNLNVDFPAGGVLVCKVTTPDFVPLMRKAAAIVTDQGGILSHAAIVARELKIPCIVAAGNATQVLKNGQTVLVNADAGIVNLA